MPEDRLPKLNRRRRNIIMVAKGTTYSFYIRKFTVLLKALEIFSLLRLSAHPDPPKAMHVHLTVCAHRVTPQGSNYTGAGYRAVFLSQAKVQL